MATFPDSLLNASFVTDSSSGDEDEPMPWEQDDFIPVTSSGRQRSPNNIRNQLRKYMDASFETETAIIERMGVSYDDFWGFMNPPKEYIKDQWSAVGNSTYWAAARLLEQVRCEAKLTERANKKRKTVGGLPLLRPTLAFGNRGRPTREAKANAQQLMEFVNEVDLPSIVPVYDSYPEVVKKPTLAFGNRGRPSREAKAKAQHFMDLVNEVELPSIVPVYDSCPEVAKKIKDFLKREGVTKDSFCKALGLDHNSLKLFLMGENQDQCGNVTYRRAYVFFEKKRILGGEPKTFRRLKSEKEIPMGYSLKVRGFSKESSHLAVAGLLEWAWGSSWWSDDTAKVRP